MAWPEDKQALMVQSPVPMAMELDVTLDRSLLVTSVGQRLLAVYGAPLLQAGAERSADWHWANQGLLVCPAAQKALTSAAILTASPRTPNARQRLLVVHGATLSPPTAERSVDWHWVDQAQMACPAAQRALKMAAILPPNPRTPNARQRLLVAHGAPLLRAGAKLPADWRRANQALMACPAAQPALTVAAILPPSPQTPNARQRLLVVNGSRLQQRTVV